MSSRRAEDIDWYWQPVDRPTDVDDSLVVSLLRNVPAGSRVLEIGVGAGYGLSQLAARAGCRCVGVDLLRSAMEASRETARRAQVRMSLALASGFNLPFADEAFDAVLSMGVVEHFPVAQSRQMLLEHARVCRRGGRVVVGAPNALDCLHSVLRFWQGERYLYHPERSYTPWGLARELAAVGLAPVSRDGYGLFWSLREHEATHAVAAVLHKTGLLSRMVRIRQRSVCALLGNMTVVAALKPGTPPTR